MAEVILNSSKTETFKPITCSACGHVGIADVSAHIRFVEDQVVIRCRDCRHTWTIPAKDAITYQDHVQRIATEAYEGVTRSS